MTELKDPAQKNVIQLAIDMHKSGKTIDTIRKKMGKILLDDSGKRLAKTFLADQFAKHKYDYKKRERSPGWKSLHREPNTKIDLALNRRHQILERHFIEKWEYETPESVAQDDGFPEGWDKHIGADEEYYDIWIDRYSKQGVTIWKERGDFWYWQPPDGSEKRESFSKFDAIEAAERWLKESERR